MHFQNLKREEADIITALKIYHSNPDFLLHHLGYSEISSDFILEELAEAVQHSFDLCFVIEQNQPVGILDYKQSPDSYVYLSLLMLDAAFQKQGLGKYTYQVFESLVRQHGAGHIRIDVVNDYEPNLIPFWQRLGFRGTRSDSLTWGNKRSQILVMEKQLI